MADDSQLSPPRIVCAAVQYDSGLIVCAPRHWDLTMGMIAAHLGPNFKNMKYRQGFIDQHGNFLDRKQAWKIAQANDQIVKRVGGDYDPDTGAGILYSENLY